MHFFVRHAPSLSIRYAVRRLNRTVRATWQVTSQKNVNFAIRRFQKKCKLKHWPWFSRYTCTGTQVLADRPHVVRGVHMCAPFRVPGTERRVKNVPVFKDRKKGENFPLGALNQNYLYIRTPHSQNATHHVSWYPQVSSGWFTEPNKYSSPGPARNTVLFGKMTRKHPRLPQNVWSGVSSTGNLNMKLVLA